MELYLKRRTIFIREAASVIVDESHEANAHVEVLSFGGTRAGGTGRLIKNDLNIRCTERERLHAFAAGRPWRQEPTSIMTYAAG